LLRSQRLLPVLGFVFGMKDMQFCNTQA